MHILWVMSKTINCCAAVQKYASIKLIFWSYSCLDRFGLGYLSTVCIAFIYIYIYIHWSTCMCQCWFGVRKALSELYRTVYYLSPSWQLGLAPTIVRVYDQSTPCIPCLYVEEVVAESRPSNRARAALACDRVWLQQSWQNMLYFIFWHIVHKNKCLLWPPWFMHFQTNFYDSSCCVLRFH